jgi:hypothetical protein
LTIAARGETVVPMRLSSWRVVCGAVVLLGCSGNSVVGGPEDGGTTDLGVDAPAMDVAMDVGFDAGPRDTGVDVPADTGPSLCRSDNDCAGNELGLTACDTATGRCVACTPTSDRCPTGEYCDPMALRCTAGCRDDMACAASGADAGAAMPRCDTTTRRCVACTADSHCAPGTLCRGNECVPGCSEAQPCAAGRACCNGGCVDTAANTDHCGACGAVCAPANAAPSCAMGRCAVGMCTGSFGDCDNDPSNGCETSTATSVMHCGACGMACAARPNTQPACTAGACTYTCAEHFADCDNDPSNGCEVDLRTSAAHCGACGTTCMASNGTPVCSAGMCGLGACAAGFGNCDNNAANGCETALGTSLDHCGRCDNACPLRANGSATCAAGTCGVSCNAGFSNCDSDATNGCEVDTRTSMMHCGACGAMCPARANASPACASGTCGVTCNAGFGNCDSDPSNGCEVDTRTSGQHCGACGTVCGAGRSCVAGVCTVVCTGGQTNCSDVCVDTATSETHCGACGRACTSGQSCQAGLCCGARERNCGGTCRNLNTDNTNCGACGIACGSGTTCVNGICESTTCLPTRPCSGTACDQCGTTSYSENWEAGSSGWRVNDGGALQLLSDTSTCRGTFMRETVLASGGRTFMQRGIPVRAGQVYCMAAWIRGSAGSQPFVGIYRGNAEGVSSGEHYWLIGAPCWPSGLGQTVSPVTSNGEWRWYAREFVMPNFTHAVVMTEIFSGGTAGTADFDALQLIDGPCPQAPTGVCAIATCD